MGFSLQDLAEGRSRGWRIPARRPQRCPLGVCGGSGWLEDERGEALPCACRATKRRAALISPASRKLLKGPTPGPARPPLSLLPAPVLAELERWERRVDASVEAGEGLWISGPVASGKSSVCVWLARSALAAERSVEFTTGRDLAARLRGPDPTRMRANYATLAAAELLVIDDLDVLLLRPTPHLSGMLEELVDARWAEQRSIVVASAATANELCELAPAAVGRRVERIVSRLAGGADSIGLGAYSSSSTGGLTAA